MCSHSPLPQPPPRVVPRLLAPLPFSLCVCSVAESARAPRYSRCKCLCKPSIDIGLKVGVTSAAMTHVSPDHWRRAVWTVLVLVVLLFAAVADSFSADERFRQGNVDYKERRGGSSAGERNAFEKTDLRQSALVRCVRQETALLHACLDTLRLVHQTGSEVGRRFDDLRARLNIPVERRDAFDKTVRALVDSVEAERRQSLPPLFDEPSETVPTDSESARGASLTHVRTAVNSTPGDAPSSLPQIEPAAEVTCNAVLSSTSGAVGCRGATHEVGPSRSPGVVSSSTPTFSVRITPAVASSVNPRLVPQSHLDQAWATFRSRLFGRVDQVLPRTRSPSIRARHVANAVAVLTTVSEAMFYIGRASGTTAPQYSTEDDVDTAVGELHRWRLTNGTEAPLSALPGAGSFKYSSAAAARDLDRASSVLRVALEGLGVARAAATSDGRSAVSGGGRPRSSSPALNDATVQQVNAALGVTDALASAAQALTAASSEHAGLLDERLWRATLDLATTAAQMRDGVALQRIDEQHDDLADTLLPLAGLVPDSDILRAHRQLWVRLSQRGLNGVQCNEIVRVTAWNEALGVLYKTLAEHVVPSIAALLLCHCM
jgi:hypothetical protein